MARLMSVSLSEDAVVARTKLITRRVGWVFLTPGTPLTLCRKVMGRKPGEPLVRLADVEVVAVRREPLQNITAADCALEGFAHLTPAQFVDFFCATHRGCSPVSVITRIQWRYLDQDPS